jgi:hypothetical protein
MGRRPNPRNLDPGSNPTTLRDERTYSSSCLRGPPRARPDTRPPRAGDPEAHRHIPCPRRSAPRQHLYELAHERLVEPVRASNLRWRQQHLRPSLLRAIDWDRADQSNGLLVRGLTDSESWAKTKAALLTDQEPEFLRRSRKLWDEEQSKRRSKRTWDGTAVIVVGLVATSSLIGYFLLKAWHGAALGHRHWPTQGTDLNTREPCLSRGVQPRWSHGADRRLRQYGVALGRRLQSAQRTNSET